MDWLLGLLLLPVLVGASDGAAAAEERADDPADAIFVPDLCGAEEGAPPARSLGTLVLLTDLDDGDDYWPVVERLRAAKQPDAVVSFPPGRVAEARASLLQHTPEFVLVVTRPERIDINQHLDLLELATSLDADPFVDFAFGYVTGATPEEAMAFVERFLEVGKKKKRALPKTLMKFGPTGQATSSFGGPRAHKIAKGFKESFAHHASVEEILARADGLGEFGILRASGHGMPDGVVDGLSGTDLRHRKINFAPALYFSGPCYCGVTSGWYQFRDGAVRREVVDPMESFGLAAIASGVTALFAGLDPDRGETTSQEMEHLWVHGGPLGHATKATYDGGVLALRRVKFDFPRYVEGERLPYRNLADQMIGGGLGRTLFGDPTMAPYSATAPAAFPLKRRDTRKALDLVWAEDRGPTAYWQSVDVYRCGGGWTHRIQFREEIPTKVARELKSFELAELESADGALEGRFPTAMIERWGGKAYLHVYVVFPPKGQENVFFKQRDFTARFRFGK